MTEFIITKPPTYRSGGQTYDFRTKFSVGERVTVDDWSDRDIDGDVLVRRSDGVGDRMDPDVLTLASGDVGPLPQNMSLSSLRARAGPRRR